jgi:hypothetical protein
MGPAFSARPKPRQMPASIATSRAAPGGGRAARLLTRSGAPRAPVFDAIQGGLVIIMQRTVALAGAVLASFAIAGEARAQARVEVGILTCTARGSTGYIVTSTKYLRCRFQRPGRDEFYRGSISKFGIDLGSTGKTAMAWAVLAPTANPPPRSLSGDYGGGIGAEVTAGYGVGAKCPDRRLAPRRHSATPERSSAEGPQHRRRCRGACLAGRITAGAGRQRLGRFFSVRRGD